MFGGYTEVVAYGKVPSRKTCPDPKEQETAVTSGEQTRMLTSNQSKKGISAEITKLKDFVLLAECSELCGPVPVITVPLDVGELVDISALVVQLMSTDFQGVGRTIIYPSEDLQLLTLNLIPGWHALTNYFTVVDLHARGFVRPASIAYLSQDKQKLLLNNASLRESLKQAAHTIKCSAMKSFMADWNHMQGADESEVAKVGKRNSVNLSSSTKELGHILNVIATCLTENVDLGHEIDHMLKLVHQTTSTLSNKEVHLLLKVKNSPTMNKSSSSQNLASTLRPLIELCTGGFLLALHHLYKIQQHFSKEQDGVTGSSQHFLTKGTLLFGVCPKLPNNVRSRNEQDVTGEPDGAVHKAYLSDGPLPVVDSFRNVRANNLEDEFQRIIYNLCSSENLKEILSTSSTLQDEHPSIYENESLPNQDCVQVSCDSGLNRQVCIRHNTHLGSLWVIQDGMNHDDVGQVLSKLLRMKHPSQLFYSLLMGRLFAVTGPPQMKKDVEALVNFLGCFIPHKKWKGVWKKSWCMSFLQPSEMKSVMIIGIGLREGKRIENMMPTQALNNASVLDLKKNVFKGPKYEGMLLRDFDRKLTVVEGVDAVLNLIISILLDVERKTFLWWLSLQDNQKNLTKRNPGFSRQSSSQGYSRSDAMLLKKLSELFNEEEEG